MTKLSVDWSIKPEDNTSIDVALNRYKRHLEDKGFRTSTIEGYVGNVDRYLEFAQTDLPSNDNMKDYRALLFNRHLSRSTINNYAFAISEYHRMMGSRDEEVKQPFLTRNDNIPDNFTEDDVLKSSQPVTNLKHLAMLQTLFYGCLRASELCNLDDRDLHLESLAIHVREGKGGKDGIVYIQDECARTLKRYLAVRPSLVVDGRYPLFYSNCGRRWSRKNLHHMFVHYKKKSGIEKRGGLHVFGRHTPATIMISKGCDIRIVQTILRHNDIRTTLRYAHVSDKTKRERYEQCLAL